MDLHPIVRRRLSERLAELRRARPVRPHADAGPQVQQAPAPPSGHS